VWWPGNIDLISAPQAAEWTLQLASEYERTVVASSLEVGEDLIRWRTDGDPALSVAALSTYLGQHATVKSTEIYLHAALAIKERALARSKPLDSKPGRYRPPDALLGFLDGL
jgi:hypothetical protein